MSASGSVRGGDGGGAPEAAGLSEIVARGLGGGSEEVEASMLGGVLIGEGGGEACRRRLVRREERKAGGQSCQWYERLIAAIVIADWRRRGSRRGRSMFKKRAEGKRWLKANWVNGSEDESTWARYPPADVLKPGILSSRTLAFLTCQFGLRNSSTFQTSCCLMSRSLFV